MDKISQLGKYEEDKAYCPDCGVELGDTTNETFQKHFEKDCMGILANSLRASGFDLSEVEMEWVRCPRCGSIHLINVDEQCLCGDCGTFIPDGPILSINLTPEEGNVFVRFLNWLRRMLS